MYLDISIGGRTGGRVEFELFADITPNTAENFRGLCTGEYGIGRQSKKNLTYDGCKVFRVKKGAYIQSGDIVNNNGDGGESVYGGTFPDETFSRRHVQAGILSMANRGRNTNASQFFVTLKAAPQLDGKHVAFGQCVGGMDVIRAISQIPTDVQDKPRVDVIIVGCGDCSEKASQKALLQNDLFMEFNKRMNINEDEKAVQEKVRESDKAKKILAGTPGGVPITEEDDERDGLAAAARKGAPDEELNDGAVPRPMKFASEREKKLHELRMKMNQSRNANSKEVLEEKTRLADPDYNKKRGQEVIKARKEKEAGGKRSADEIAAAQPVEKGKEYLTESAESADGKEAKKKKKNNDAFGWNIFNSDALYNAHDKALAKVEFQRNEYEEQKKSQGLTSFYGNINEPVLGHAPSEEAKDRLADALTKKGEKKKEWSRRRTYQDDEDRTYVNDRNRIFNAKIHRAFAPYSAEIQQNLERGTAL